MPTPPFIHREKEHSHGQSLCGLTVVGLATREASAVSCPHCKMAQALMVVTKDRRIRHWLAINDPMALRQCQEALR
jgi:hypothetical protein